jgi:transglutaminase-like putative cysteine protease
MKRAPVRFSDFPSAAVLILLLLSVAQRLYATEWAPGLEISLFLTFFGTMLGLALGLSRFKRGGILWLSLGYSVSFIPLLAGWIFYQKTPWLERMLNLGGRLGYSISLFFHTQPVPDTILFVIFTGLGLWIISIIAGYSLMRKADFISAVLPAGIVLVIIQLYDSKVGARMLILAFFAFLSLVLLGRLMYVRKRLFWKEQRVLFSAEAWNDLNLIIPLVALFLVILAAVMPVPSLPLKSVRAAWQSVTHPWENLRENLANATTGLKGGVKVGIFGFYGSSLALGNQASTGDAVYLRIRAPLIKGTGRYYWRVRSYDQYLDDEWQSVFRSQKTVNPDETSLPLVDFHGLSSEFVFTAPQAGLSILVTPAHPIWISRPSIMTFLYASDDLIDPLMFSVDPPIMAGEQYTVHANVFNPSIADLQQAGTDYPEWVKLHYLQVPEGLSSRIFELSQQITENAENPYDKAYAITDYLRTSITYSESVETPPDRNDPLEWFLFNSKAGFCNYYATAEVLLLRIAGIPARMAVGFAEGEFVPPGTYVIREKDAHAWPEVYFPGVGWVEFEPTSSQPQLTRPLANQAPTGQSAPVTPENGNQGNGNPALLPGENTGTSSGSPLAAGAVLRLMLLFGLIVAIIVGGAAVYISGILDRILQRIRLPFRKKLPVIFIEAYTRLSLYPPSWLLRWAYISSLNPIERAFGVVFQTLRWLGVNPSYSQTPAEVAATLKLQMPEAANEIHSLLWEYQHALYSQEHSDLYIARRAAASIRRQALRAAVWQRMNRLRGTFQRFFSPRE